MDGIENFSSCYPWKSGNYVMSIKLACYNKHRKQWIYKNNRKKHAIDNNPYIKVTGYVFVCLSVCTEGSRKR